MTMTDAELAEIRARAEAATPGGAERIATALLLMRYAKETAPEMFSDTSFACDPSLLDEVERLRKENERYREAAEAAIPLLQTHSCWHDVFPELDCCEYGLVAEQVSVALGNEPLPIYAEYLHSATEDADDRTT